MHVYFSICVFWCMYVLVCVSLSMSVCLCVYVLVLCVCGMCVLMFEVILLVSLA